MKISKGLRQAYDLQDFTYQATLALRKSLLKRGRLLRVSREDAAAISLLVKAWELCQERIRIHRNKPMPGVLRPDAAKRLRKPGALAAHSLATEAAMVKLGYAPTN
jgi:hypothetical protein